VILPKKSEIQRISSKELRSIFEFFKKNKIYFFILGGIFFFIFLLILILKKVPKKENKDRLKNCIGLHVFSEEGIKIGIVKDISLKKNKIYQWLIKPDRKLNKKIKTKKILLNHKHVQSINEIIIIDKQVSKHLKKNKLFL